MLLLLLVGAGTGAPPATDGRGRAGGADARLSLGGLGDARLYASGGDTVGLSGGGLGDAGLSGAGGSAAGLGGAGGSDE